MKQFIQTVNTENSRLNFLHYHVGHRADIKFQIKSRGGGGLVEGLVFEILTLEVGTRNDVWIKTSCHMVAVIALGRFRIVTNSYAASFSRNVILYETNNIFLIEFYKLRFCGSFFQFSISFDNDSHEIT